MKNNMSYMLMLKYYTPQTADEIEARAAESYKERGGEDRYKHAYMFGWIKSSYETLLNKYEELKKEYEESETAR